MGKLSRAGACWGFMRLLAVIITLLISRLVFNILLRVNYFSWEILQFCWAFFMTMEMSMTCDTYILYVQFQCDLSPLANRSGSHLWTSSTWLVSLNLVTLTFLVLMPLPNVRSWNLNYGSDNYSLSRLDLGIDFLKKGGERSPKVKPSSHALPS